ncbi:MAG: cysteine synthase family protein [Roseibacillus sp.]|nr:cysteine synthase family protein [Roseibacillus sp.]
MPLSPVLPEANSYLHQVRPTPLVRVSLPDSQSGSSGRSNMEPGIWCKLEFLNPSGSTKDRIARHILEKAWRQGHLNAGHTVAEASSGSTSIAFALACSQMNLHFVAFIPDTATSERELIIKAYGGEVRRISGGMPEVLRAARETSEAEGWFLGRQFANEDNTEAHRLHTGPEILEQIPGGNVDAVVSGVGTGGTLRGLYEAFAGAGCPVSAHAAIPRDLALFGSNLECCSLRFSSDVPGVVEGLSEIYAQWQCDRLREWEIGDRDCLELTRKLWSLGFPVGPSSGLNFAAALEVATELGPDAQVVTVFPDRMERYFSHKVFEEIRDRS